LYSLENFGLDTIITYKQDTQIDEQEDMRLFPKLSKIATKRKYLKKTLEA